MNYLENKYIHLISNRLLRFKKIGQRYNFRCPICNDSEKSKTKARGWLFSDTKSLTGRYFCHNCGAAKSFKSFLYDIDNRLYFDYIQETLLEDSSYRPPTKTIEVEDFISKRSMVKERNPLEELQSISSLEDDHYAKIYVKKRLIPEKEWSSIYYCVKFKEWTNSIIPDKFESTKRDESRLILPFIDEEGILFGYQGRSFRKDQDLKYITIMIDESRDKIFGLNRVDNSRPKRAVEGPIDTFFIDNCMASAGGNIETYFTKDTIIIYDNERYSKQTIRKMNKAIDLGYPIVIWPDRVKEKDANLIYISGLDIESLIKENTYSGLEAKMKLNLWRRDR